MNSFSDRDGQIWFDGELVPWRQANTHVLTHSLHYGVGCFEGVRAYGTPEGPAVFRLQDHTRRLLNSAKILGMPVSWSEEALNEAQLAVLRANTLDHAYIRPMIFYGAEGMGLRADNLKSHAVVAAWRWGSYLGEEAASRGVRVKTSSYNRHHVNTAMCRAKANGHYINSILALSEVLRDGYDEALTLDTEGFIAEGSAENIFLVRGGELHTPEATSCLDGITRRTIMTIARNLGIAVTERRITRDELFIADEAFFTGTAAEVTPIREVDNRTIGDGRRGPLTERLQKAYMLTVTGALPKYADWLTRVVAPIDRAAG